MDLIRIWQECDLSDIENHIVIVDDIQGFCPSCKKTGIKYEDFAKCPSCGIEFKYAATRESGTQAAHIIDKIRKKAPHLAIVDHGDYNALLNRQKTKSLFKN
jgi:ribosomal protein L37AE/L43A